MVIAMFEISIEDSLPMYCSVQGGLNNSSLQFVSPLARYILNIEFEIEHCWFYNNSALWGGGALVEFQDNARNNFLQIYSSHFISNKCESDFHSCTYSGTGGGGLRILFNVLKQGKPYSVQISARNNGNIQGTLEVEKIDPIG